MNKFIIFILILVASPIFSNAQKLSSKKKRQLRKYLNFIHKESNVINVNRYQTVEKADSNFIQKTFNPDKIILTHEKGFKESNCKTLHGRYTEWYDNGNKWKEGYYLDNQTNGKWTFYDFDNNSTETGLFINDKKEGLWIIKDSSSKISQHKNYTNGLLNGESIGFDSLGNIAFKWIHKNDKLIDLAIIDTSVFNKLINTPDEIPCLAICSKFKGKMKEECRDFEYLKYIYGNIKYPKNAIIDDIEGTALINFIVHKDGSLSDFVVYRGVCDDIEIECLKILKNSPAWSPGIVNDNPVKTSFMAPIKFRLE